MFSKTYQLSLTRNYVSGWGVPEAVRELLQNALDSDAELEYEIEPMCYAEASSAVSLEIISRGVKLPPRCLLLGATSKADSPDKIGSFGEGFKIAVLVLLRSRVGVTIFNDDLLWEPSFQHSPTFNEEILVIKETKNKSCEGLGLRFQLTNVPDEAMATIFENTLQMQASYEVLHHTSKGEILADKPGQIFVNGLFVCKTDMQCGYNFKPEFLPLERDRQTVSSFNLAVLVKDAWFETGAWEAICTGMEEEWPDFQYASWSAPELLKEECYKRFQETNPGYIAADSRAEMKKKIESGMTKTVYVGGSYGSAIRESSSYKNSEQVQAAVAPSPQELLTLWFRINRTHMRTPAIVSFKDILAASAAWK